MMMLTIGFIGIRFCTGKNRKFPGFLVNRTSFHYLAAFKLRNMNKRVWLPTLILVFLLVNLAVDLLYAVVDPRIDFR